MTVLIIGGAYQGKRKVAENLYVDLPRIENLHEIVRKMLKEDKDPLSLADTLCGHVITCDEIGCGIVPVDADDRLWREMTGDACQYLAARAGTVFHVVCGIPVLLKGGEQ